MADVTTAQQVQAYVVQVASCMIADAPMIWDWLNEFPLRNFDDFGPKTLAEFTRVLQRRIDNERVWIAFVQREPAGIIGYASVNSYCGHFHGICFAKKWHGQGVARAAVSKVIDEVFLMSDKQKISASFFRDNHRIQRFLRTLGFKFEGLLTAQTLRGGQPVDMLLMALFKEDWLCRSAGS
jgi:RimJ/RimL family protein N-acetyltransferase